MIDMIGVGPFITIPLIIAAAGGPQAMLGWILGAVFALCDGLVWAELGAAMPNAGGSYQYLKESYGPNSLGRLLSFLFIWQLSFSAPLSIASGCIGLSHYAGYLWPGLERTIAAHTFHLGLPLIGTLEARVLVMPATWVAIATCAVVVWPVQVGRAEMVLALSATRRVAAIAAASRVNSAVPSLRLRPGRYRPPAPVRAVVTEFLTSPDEQPGPRVRAGTPAARTGSAKPASVAGTTLVDDHPS